VGLAGPKGVASNIVSKWEETINKTLKDSKVIATIEKLGGVLVDFKHGEDYRKELMKDLAMYREIIPTLPDKK